MTFAKMAAAVVTDPSEVERLAKLAAAVAAANPARPEDDEDDDDWKSNLLWSLGGLGALAGGGYLAYKSGLLDAAGGMFGGDDSDKGPVQSIGDAALATPAWAAAGIGAANAARGTRFGSQVLPGRHSRGLLGYAEALRRLEGVADPTGSGAKVRNTAEIDARSALRGTLPDVLRDKSKPARGESVSGPGSLRATVADRLAAARKGGGALGQLMAEQSKSPGWEKLTARTGHGDYMAMRRMQAGLQSALSDATPTGNAKIVNLAEELGFKPQGGRNNAPAARTYVKQVLQSMQGFHTSRLHGSSPMVAGRRFLGGAFAPYLFGGAASLLGRMGGV